MELEPHQSPVFLKENYGYQECGVISDYAHSWLADKNKTYVRSVRLTAAIQIGLETRRPLAQDELEAIVQSDALLHQTLDTMAVVNIKKHSGESRSDDAEIRNESRLNAVLLREQIRTLCPTVIIAGGTVCWHSLVYDIGLYDGEQDRVKFDTAVCAGTVLCHSNHPAARRKGEFDIDRLHRAILSAHDSSVIGIQN